MTKPEFEKLLQRYLQGECTEEERIKIQLWFDSIQERNGFTLSEEEKEKIEKSLSLNIDNQIDSKENTSQDSLPFIKKLNSYLIYFGIAASLMLAIFLIKNEWSTMENSLLIHSYLFDSAENQIIHKTNKSVVNERIILEDGSKVNLTSGSSISYKAHFDSTKRIVTLKGAGFFQVTKNVNKPFYVLCQGTVTKVMGTSFWVNSNPKSKSVEVGVKSGKVSVFVNHDHTNNEASKTESQVDPVYLMPNQRVVFFEKQKKIEKTLVTKPQMLETPEVSKMQFIYKETPLPTVLSELSKSYGVQIIIGDARLNKRSFTGDLMAMSFDEKFALICASVSAEYKILGTDILLTAHGNK